MRAPRVLIAAIQSSSGKTTIATGLMGALRESGFTVQGFKVGPDYIDPAYHSAVTSQFSRNLDIWMLTKNRILELFQRNVRKADISIIEGVMGLFDGIGGLHEAGSTAHLSKILRCPIILVIDAWGMAASAAAVAAGCKILDRKLNLAGVILNKVSGEKHIQYCKEAIERVTKIPVVGALPFNPQISLPERHLGLVPTYENKRLHRILSKVVHFVKAHVDLQRVTEVARSAPELTDREPETGVGEHRTGKAVVGVAFDEAFNFYYQDAIEMLRASGAEIRFFSPIHNRTLPEEVHGLYIGGGFPEVLAEKLSINQRMLKDVRKVVEHGMPTFAECGGLMYLTNSITNFEGGTYKMVGILDGNTVMERGLCLNYTLARVLRENPISEVGDSIRGHEFHYSRIVDIHRDARFAYAMKRGVGIDGKRDGWLEYAVLAPYMHMHLASKTKYAARFVNACRAYSRK